MRSLIRLLAAGLVILGQGLSPPTALASSPEVDAYDLNVIRVIDEQDGASAQWPGRRGWRRSAHTTGYFYRELERLDTDRFCLRPQWTRTAAVAAGARWTSALAISNLMAACPVAPPAERPPERVADDVARQFWDVRVLPHPDLRVVPDYAITGKPVYLEIAGPKEQHFDVDNPLGQDVVITATSRYVIDWGDGSTDDTASQGGPWPHGDVTHAYTRVASGVTITVTQLWSARWSTGDASGELADLRTTSSVVLSVTQLQAVRNF